jgi:acyl-CoA synthetase (AMP-forming)/AMP-acid ligase II
MGFSHVLYAGATLALGKKFSTSLFWDEVRQHGATMIQYVGETCRYLLSAPIKVDPITGECLDKKHNVRVAFGNGMRPDVWAKFKERFGIDTILEFYGSTEGSFATYNLSRNDYSAGAIGRSGWLFRAFLGSAVTLVKVDHETDEPYRNPKTGLCGPPNQDEAGELLFKLTSDVKQRFQGYYGDAESTKKKILRDVFRKGDAWFRTGDVMKWDRDGRMYFSDRIGDTFRWKSENVSTAEVAHVLGLHSAVREANVYGIELPHHDGRAGCAAVILEPPTPPSEDLLRNLAGHVQESLPKYALPLFLRVVPPDKMHTTGTNKQQKHLLRKEGVSPKKTGKDAIYWLRDGTYVKFGPDDWHKLTKGKVKL